jgi:putative ABC transport system permease protein
MSLRLLRIIRLRIRTLLRREVAERELDAELGFHLEQQVAENVASGMSPEDARLAALRSIGGMAQIAEECRDARKLQTAETTWQDLRFGARMLAKNPGFATIAVLTLALGIGANTAAFSAANSLLFGGLPVAEPDRLVLGEALREGFDPGGSSLLEYSALRHQNKVFTSTTLSLDRSLLLRGKTEAEEVQAAAVAPNFVETLGVRPILGRAMTAKESQSGGAVLLIAYDFWQRRFGGDRNALGQTLDLDGTSYTVVGVMPPGFDYPTGSEAWIPLDSDADTAPMDQRIRHEYIFTARLQPGVSFRQADGEMKLVAHELERQYPQTERGWSYGLLTMRQWSLGDDDGHMTRAILVLMLAVGFLLLICCVNVANLLLVRGVVRERELAIRVALGASGRRVFQQLLTEGLLLSVLGGAVGLLVSYGLLRLLSLLNPIQPHSFAPLVIHFRNDARAMTFCVAISVFSGVLFSVLPAIKLAGLQDPISTLRQREHRAGGVGARRGWLRGLVAVEIALAFALSFGGALLTKSFYRLASLDLGYRPEHLLTIELPLAGSEYRHQADKVGFIDRLLERVRALPGVEGAGTTTDIPMQQFSSDTIFTVEGHPPRNPSQVPISALRWVSPGYAEALGLTLIKGRTVTTQDRAETLPVAVISEELAHQAFGNDDPIGRRLRRGREQNTKYPWLIVVGVVRDPKEDRLNFRIARPVLYVPYSQRADGPGNQSVSLVLRTAADPTEITAAVRGAIHEINPYQPLLAVNSMQALVASVLSSDRFSARVMGMLAAVGLFLSGLGLYGVMAYSVSQRTTEIGLRMALGAQPRSVFALIAREGGRLVALGLALALPAMFLVARLLGSVLFSVSAGDPGILAILALLLTGVAFLACFLPARRAIRLDPLRALHDE